MRARSHSAARRACAGRGLGEGRPDGLKTAHFIADGTRLVASRGEGKRAGERQHGIVEPSTRARFALLVRFFGGLLLLQSRGPTRSRQRAR